MPAAKQVVYVDVDDEITAIIDKMNNADAKVVALVLPKRAAVFQSIVNMKLLKRRAEQANKHLVLITSEAGLLPLAGMAGVYVAPTLQSKPEIPSAPASDGLPTDDEPVAMAGDDFDPDKNAAVPVGALAASQGLPGDMQELDKAAAGAGGKPSPQMAAMAAGGADKAKPKDKKLQVPNFFRFRKRLIFIGLGLIALIVLLYVAWFVLPTASVTIKTRTSDIEANIDLTLDTDATAVEPKVGIVPAKILQQQKAATQQAPATGTENRGEKATGKVTLSLEDCSQNTVSVPAGTGLSSGGKTFITQSSATLSSVKIGGSCRNADFENISSASVDVIAQKGGADHNIAPASFAGAPASVKAVSTDPMAGGTDKIIKIVQASDIEAAKAKMSGNTEKDTAKEQLKKMHEENGMFPVEATFLAESDDITTSVKVGDEAEAVTVSQTTTYTMYGVKKADLRKVVEAEVDEEIDTSKQSILDDGISKAKFLVPDQGTPAKLRVAMTATAVAGPQLDVEAIKQEMSGMKSGVVKDHIKSNPGVDDVVVKYSPFWVTTAPKPEKIKVVFEKTGEVERRSDKNDDKDSNNDSGDSAESGGNTGE